MKFQKATNRFFLFLLPFLFTGCYTQFQTFDKFPIEGDRYADYYSWDGFEEGKSTDIDNSGTSYYINEEEEYLDEELALEEDGIYYIDYETEQWYKDHFATGVNYSNPEKMYWIGYGDGYHDATDDLRPDYWDSAWFYNNWYSSNIIHRNQFRTWYRFNYGSYSYFNVWLAYNDYPYSFNGFRSSRYSRLGYPMYGYAGFGFGHSFYRYPGYHPYYGMWDWYGYPSYYGSTIIVYNNYHKSKKYSRNADIYRKGPRGSGLSNSGDYRTRSGRGLTNNTRGNGLTRSRGINSGVRVRSSGSSTNRGTSVGRSSGTRTRGSSVGKSRSGSSNNNGRSRGSGSSVGKDRGSKSNGSSGTKSRSRGNNDSALSSTSVRTIDISDYNGRSYTIPARKVRTSGLNRSSSSRSAFRDFFSRSIFNTTSSDFNLRSRINTSSSRSTNRGSFSNSSSRKSSGAKVTRSSSSSRSSGTRSRGSSSSSKKKSRGGN
ncbi:hypothetical protein [Gracilimonas sp.]|uniref:hypothetical protein n=1 Tax=Gracilimonas sp. TaxID=1974203 RepID=UPI0032EE0893